MPSYAYFRKQFVPLSDASLGVMTHCLHYGTAVFEGIRGNWNADAEQLYLFRLKEHYARLLTGCRILKIDLPHTVDELCEITVETGRCFICSPAGKGSELRIELHHNLGVEGIGRVFQSIL